jgi:hypothetical protein
VPLSYSTVRGWTWWNRIQRQNNSISWVDMSQKPNITWMFTIDERHGPNHAHASVQPSSCNNWNQFIQLAHLLDHFVLSICHFVVLLFWCSPVSPIPYVVESRLIWLILFSEEAPVWKPASSTLNSVLNSVHLVMIMQCLLDFTRACHIARDVLQWNWSWLSGHWELHWRVLCCPQGPVTDAPCKYACPVGHYCPTGSALPLPCPAGMYQVW